MCKVPSPTAPPDALHTNCLIVKASTSERSSFTKSKASSYGLTGWVKNRSGGQVEGEAQGDDESIQKLLKVLESGPPAATVEKVDQSEIEVKEGESGYTTK
ncbi:MAG: hypothetical protein L6R39_003557 [Caloplaca ligustica]|nr:MAG: hypothetical protein L6R39_003557 [Caloplaca ligustica]